MVKIFESPRGNFSLGRHDEEDHPSLQAWDAADEYLLSRLGESAFSPPGSGRLLILNDSFGALCTALSDFSPTLMTDSFRSRAAVLRNLARNGIPDGRVRFLTPFEEPEPWVLCLVRVPKSLSLLEFELSRIRASLASGAQVIGGGMTRNIHTSTIGLFETLLGPATTSPAWKKARLIFCRPGEGTGPDPAAASPAESPAGPPAAGSPSRAVYDPATGLRFVRFPGVFSREGIDPGTRLLLERMPAGTPRRVIDLGCGAGVIGLAAAKRYPGAEISLVDESFLAVESSRETFRLNGMEARGNFLWGNGLDSFSPESADLILCNPPFHEGGAVSTSAALTMFRDALRVLRKGGELRLVTNAHLGYGRVLRGLFPNSSILTKNEKYIVFSCGKG